MRVKGRVRGAIVESFGRGMFLRRWVIGTVFGMMAVDAALAWDVLVAFHLSGTARIAGLVLPLLALLADDTVHILLGNGLPGGR